jgi:hypothetical protein
MAEYHMLSKIITEWNFTDKDKNVLEITAENVKLALSIFDLDAIHKVLGISTLNDSQKKS